MDQQEQMKFFYEIFAPSLPRLGPGDDASTRRALQALLAERLNDVDASAPAKLRVLDIGCGNGAQTIQLAKRVDGRILAVDNHQPYLDELQRRAEAAGVSARIQPCLRDMRDLGLEESSFDLIWSEGALFVMGFGEGLKACHSLLAPRGLLAVTELSWLRHDPPAESHQFFSSVYPAMADVGANLAAIEACGYEVLDSFALPESAWWEPYYHPLEERLRSFRKQYATDPEKLGMVESIQMEVDIYRKHSGYYGNVFYLARRG